MSKKKLIKIHKPILFKELIRSYIKKNIVLTTNCVTLNTLEVSKQFKLGESGRFFKQITFFVLGFTNLYQKTYKLLKIKSIIFALWNTLATYNIIF